jgi:hypothetical protein
VDDLDDAGRRAAVDLADAAGHRRGVIPASPAEVTEARAAVPPHHELSLQRGDAPTPPGRSRTPAIDWASVMTITKAEGTSTTCGRYGDVWVT